MLVYIMVLTNSRMKYLVSYYLFCTKLCLQTELCKDKASMFAIAHFAQLYYSDWLSNAAS